MKEKIIELIKEYPVRIVTAVFILAFILGGSTATCGYMGADDASIEETE